MRPQAFLPLVGVCLIAQAPSPHIDWVTIDGSQASSSSTKLDLRYAVLHNPGGWQVLIKNFGSTPVTFRYWIPGVETADQSMTNPLMHIGAGAMVRLFLDQPPTGFKVLDLAVEPGFTFKSAQ